MRLINIEIVEGRSLRFNFDFDRRWDIQASRGQDVQAPRSLAGARQDLLKQDVLKQPVDVYLDHPRETFLFDQLGRQHPLLQVTGISAEQPVRVSPKSSKRFTLTFSLPADMESFIYQTTLLVRAGGEYTRLEIKTEEEINLRDFR
ncbi:MAG: hypothetical protein AUI33_17820 [Ignavibacteria bacterium 13_1_40CM_2_61_4]|nr:MAG: hypothetical protein AUI33_17820 [Ignavibacteria bacterium 13_1_40CM_2_61_4]